MLTYLLKVNVAIVLFYAFYRLFFYKDTFFGWRRTALLCFYVVAAATPLLNIQAWITEQEPMVAVVDLYATIILPEFTISPETEATDWKSMILLYANATYWVVVSFLAIRFTLQLIGIIRLAWRCGKMQVGHTVVHLLPQAGIPFSFFHWIFIHPASHTEEEFNEILAHEQAHARQWHSIDVLVSELACMLCWFNPFVWLMKREIRNNLEFMADARVLENGYDSKTYQYHLLGLSHHKAAATIYNNFNVLPLKKRIKMMNRRRTREIGRTKYLMFLPLAALLMIVSNIEVVARTTGRIATDMIEAAMTTEKPYTEALSDSIGPDEVIFEVVEQMPLFAEGGMQGLMEYLSKNIKYPAEAKAKGIQGRVVVQFIVSKDGSIVKPKILRHLNPALDQEAIRVVSNMPKWKPAMQRGQAVNVKYTLPVVFNLSGKKIAPPPPPFIDANGIYEVAEHMPEFPGGMKVLMEYISKNIQYPPQAKAAGTEGRVIVQMIIDKEGNVTNVKILRSVDPLLDAEAIRLTNAMPKWKPGIEKGKAVPVKYTLPIIFKLK